MGTNFYWNHDHCESCNRSEKVHLGKRSGGWKFLFHGYDSPFDSPVGVVRSKAEWELVLREQKGFVTDEYGERVEVDDFLKMVQDWQDQPNAHSAYMAENHPEVENRGFTDSGGYEVLCQDFS